MHTLYTACVGADQQCIHASCTIYFTNIKGTGLIFLELYNFLII